MVVFGVAGDVGAYVVEGEFAAGGLGGVEEGEGEVGEAFEVVVAAGVFMVLDNSGCGFRGI